MRNADGAALRGAVALGTPEVTLNQVASTSSASILSMLHGRASLRPDDVAFTYTDYDLNSEGVAESLTWSQLARQTSNVAREIALHGSVGDRALILAPQGLDYILAFLGAMQAGRIAVPLPLPHRGSNHDRVDAVLADTEPAVVLTTSAVAADVGTSSRRSVWTPRRRSSKSTRCTSTPRTG